MALQARNILPQKFLGFRSKPILLFLIWPLFALILSIKNYRQVWAKNIVWMFTIFFGYNIISQGSYTDIQGYINQFKEIVTENLSFQAFWVSLYASGSGIADRLPDRKNLKTFIRSNISDS